MRNWRAGMPLMGYMDGAVDGAVDGVVDGVAAHAPRVCNLPPACGLAPLGGPAAQSTHGRFHRPFHLALAFALLDGIALVVRRLAFG